MINQDSAGAGLVFRDVEIRLSGRHLLAVNCSVEPGAVLSVMGPSGSGKSTFFAFVAGFLDPAFRSSGRILLNGADITDRSPERRGIGLLFQDHLMFPHLSVAGNLAFGLPPASKGGPRGQEARTALVDQALSDIGLTGFQNRDPQTLSGGQRARVALMRTLLSEPKALLLDEPFSKLDATLKEQIRSLVFEAARKRGLPTVLVTHDPHDAEAAGGATITLGGLEKGGEVGPS